MGNLIIESRYAITQHARVPSQFYGVPLGGMIAFVALLAMGANISQDWFLRLAVLGVINVGILGVANSVINERMMGWDRFQKSTPVRPWTYILAKIILGVAMTSVLTATLPIIGYLSGINISYFSWLVIIAILTLGSVIFTSLGLVLVYALNPQAAQAILAYAGLVLLVPVFLNHSIMPEWLRYIFGALPSTLFIETIISIVTENTISISRAAYLCAYTLLFVILSQHLFSKDEK